MFLHSTFAGTLQLHNIKLPQNLTHFGPKHDTCCTTMKENGKTKTVQYSHKACHSIHSCDKAQQEMPENKYWEQTSSMTENGAIHMTPAASSFLQATMLMLHTNTTTTSAV